MQVYNWERLIICAYTLSIVLLKIGVGACNVYEIVLTQYQNSFNK